MSKTGNVFSGILEYLNEPFFKYIPIIGWLLNIFLIVQFVVVNFMTLIYALLTISLSGLLIFIVYHLDLDYYEDALQTTINKENTF